MTEEYEYAPEHVVRETIMAADSGECGGWERWRRDEVLVGEWWYRRKIKGVPKDGVSAMNEIEIYEDEDAVDIEAEDDGCEFVEDQDEGDFID